MNKLFLSSLVGAALMMLSGAILAKCDDMRVIVRNSVYPIHGLEAFCTDFNQMRAELAGMRSELSIAREQNAMLKARLEAAFSQGVGQEPVETTPIALESASTVLSR